MSDDERRFKLVFRLAEVGRFDSLREAFEEMYRITKETKPLTRQCLAATWIEDDGVPIFFDHIVEKAHAEGWLSESGELVPLEKVQ